MTTVPDNVLPEPSNEIMRYQSLPFLLLCIGIITGIVLETIFFGSPSKWIGHAVSGTAGLILLVLVIITGAIRSGRVTTLHFRQVHLLHKIASVSFTGVAVGTFSLGLLVVTGHGEPVLTTLHGWLGLTVAALSAVQMLPSLFITRRQSIRKFHRIVGYLIVPLFLFQIFLGLDAAELFEGGLD